MLARLLLGTPNDTPSALTIASLGETALLAVGIACWLGREEGRARVAAMLLCHIFVTRLLDHGAVGWRFLASPYGRPLPCTSRPPSAITSLAAPVPVPFVPTVRQATPGN